MKLEINVKKLWKSGLSVKTCVQDIEHETNLMLINYY